MTDARNGTDQAVRVAVVGLGYWGPNLVRNVFELPEMELVAVCDLDTERLNRIRRRYPDVRRTKSYAELLEDPTIEGVAIATAVSSHFELARAALEAGKHVLVEKPMAASSHEASELIALAGSRGLVLMPGHTFLYSPPVNAVRDLIWSGELGDIYFISSSRVNLGLHQPDVSVIWDLGPHDFSILRYWLKEKPSSVSATSRGCVMPSIPDVAFVNLGFPSGAIANVHLAWLAPTKLRQTVVVGSEKMVVYDDTSREPVRIHDSGAVLDDPLSFGEYRLTYRTGPIISPPIEATEPLALELRDFCSAIREGHDPSSSAQIGLDVVEMVEAAESAMSDPGVSVRIDHSEDGSSLWRGSRSDADRVSGPMRGALVTSTLLRGEPAVVALSIAVAFGLASPAQTKFLVFVAVAIAVILALWLPTDAFLAASLAVFVTYSLSSDYAVDVGGISVHATDLLIALVVLRAIMPRPRRRVGWAILDAPTAAAVLIWALVMVTAAMRGHLAGTPVERLIRLDAQLLYYLLLSWGFIRVLRERDVSSTRIAKALAGTALAFVGYMAYERLVQHRFDAAGHVGPVITAQGVILHRDYGVYSAYTLYGLAALAAIAYALFVRRAHGIVIALAGIFVAAAALTLVRAVVFGMIVGVAVLLLFALRRELRPRLQVIAPKIVVLAVMLTVAMGMFWAISPTSARGVTDRFLPGVAPQSHTAIATARYRQQALSFGFQQANAHPLGRGMVSGSSTAELVEALYLIHSAWATLLVYTGWLGLLAFLSAAFLLVRRSFRLPDASDWLQPFFVAVVALLFVGGFGADNIVSQPWVLGPAALVIGLRFGLADLDDESPTS